MFDSSPEDRYWSDRDRRCRTDQWKARQVKLSTLQLSAKAACSCA